MKYPRIFTLAILAVCACLTACGNDPDSIAKQQKAAAIGKKLLDLGVKHNVLTNDEAATFLEIGEITLDAVKTPPPSSPAEQTPPDAKSPPNKAVTPLSYKYAPFRAARPQYCANMPRAPPMAKANPS